jgi:hypothetical protein
MEGQVSKPHFRSCYLSPYLLPALSTRNTEVRALVEGATGQGRKRQQTKKVEAKLRAREAPGPSEDEQVRLKEVTRT